jgi:hypothetical protein
VATTAGLGIAAIIAGVTANARYDELQSSCGKAPSGCTEAEIDSVKTRVTITNVLWVMSGAAAVTSGVLFYVDARGKGASIALRF